MKGHVSFHFPSNFILFFFHVELIAHLRVLSLIKFSFFGKLHFSLKY